jgi:hypothetical protein
MKSAYESGDIRWAEFGLGVPDINQSTVNASSLTSLGDGGEYGTTRNEIELAGSPEADELGSPDYIQIDWHLMDGRSVFGHF